MVPLKIFKLFVTDESEVEETISLARSVLTEGKMVLIKSVSKFGVHAQVVGQIRKKVTLPKINPDLKPSVTYFYHFSNPEKCTFVSGSRLTQIEPKKTKN